MSEPKLYRVRIEADVYVVAASEHDAEDYALRDYDVVNDAMEHADATASVVTAKSLSGAEENCLPWVDDDLDDDEVDRDRTVGAWAELNDEAAARAKCEAGFNAKQLNIPGT